MIKTKHRCIYYRDNKDGSRSFYLHITINGKRTWRKAGSTITDARTLYRDYEKLKGLEGFGLKMPGRILFEDLAARYLKDYIASRPDVKPANIVRIKSSIKALTHIFGGQLITSITNAAIDDAALRRQELIYLRAILRKGHRWEYLNQMPQIIVETDSAIKRRALDPDEVRTILEQASPLHADAIRLSLYLAMRLGELCKITADNTDFERGTITIAKRKTPRRKSSNPKRFALIDEAAPILKRRFLENGGRAFTESSSRLSDIFYKERKRIAGTRGPWDFHCFRHTALTWLEESGIQGKPLQDIAGHKSIETTYAHYVHRNIERERDALALIAEKLSS